MVTREQSQRSRIAELLQSHPLDLVVYEKVYKHFHANPELSLHEEKTSSTVAKHSSLSAYTVRTSIGGHGLAGVLYNGEGPTVLLRADMDALPVEEKTELAYASKATTKDADANWLASEGVKDSWTGTLVVVFQPNEERGGGASAMVEGGLYDKVPIPDVVLAQHVMPFRTGKVMVKAGTMIAAADSFKITVFGRGGHGSMPQLCIDPVLLAANIVVRLQGIVAREVDPQDAAVVTVGSLQAGLSENVIADQAILKVDIRTQKDKTRKSVLKAVKRVVEKECEASGCEKPPTFEQIRKFPLTVNDEDATEKISEAFKASLEKSSTLRRQLQMHGEKWDKAEKAGRIAEDIPVSHSGLFAPVIQRTMKTGVEALCVAALAYLGRKA